MVQGEIEFINYKDFDKYVEQHDKFEDYSFGKRIEGKKKGLLSKLDGLKAAKTQNLFLRDAITKELDNCYEVEVPYFRKKLSEIEKLSGESVTEVDKHNTELGELETKVEVEKSILKKYPLVISPDFLSQGFSSYGDFIFEDKGSKPFGLNISLPTYAIYSLNNSEINLEFNGLGQFNLYPEERPHYTKTKLHKSSPSIIRTLFGKESISEYGKDTFGERFSQVKNEESKIKINSTFFGSLVPLRKELLQASSHFRGDLYLVTKAIWKQGEREMFEGEYKTPNNDFMVLGHNILSNRFHFIAEGRTD